MKTKDWISTKDRLPEANNRIDNFMRCSDEVLICLNNNEVVTGRFYMIDYMPLSYWLSTLGEHKYPSYLVTHWQEIVLPKMK